MPESTANQRSKPSLPHRRLRNLYIAVFLVLGAALCGSEVFRQIRIQQLTTITDYTDLLREQGGRIGELGTRATVVRGSQGSPDQASLIDELQQRASIINRSHAGLLEVIASEGGLEEGSTTPIRDITGVLEQIESVINTQDASLIASQTPLLVQEYRLGLQQAAISAFQQNRLSARRLAYSSLALFCVIAVLLLIEALFLIIPATTKLRSQWNRLIENQRENARLSDRFHELIDSASSIRQFHPTGARVTESVPTSQPEHEALSPVDLDELRAVEAGLRLLEAAVVNSRDGILIVECAEGHRVVFCNQAAMRITGLSRQQIVGKAPWQLHASRPESTDRLRSATESCGLGTLELVLDRTDGEQIQVRVDLVPVASSQGGPTHIVLSYRDITESVRAQQALHESLDRFELIGRISLEGIYDLDLNTGRCWRNEHLIRHFGSPNEDDKDFFAWLRSRLHPDDADRAIASFRDFVQSDRSSWEDEYRQLRTDGTWAYVRDRASLLRDADGKPYRLVGSLEDLTELRQQQWDIQQNNERLQKILDDQTDLVCRYDLDLTLTFVNQAYAEYFGRDRDELIGTPFTELIPAEDREKVTALFRSLTSDTPTFSSEHRVTLADGSIRWQRWTDRAILNPDQEVIAYQAVGRDVTEEVLAKRELEQAESRYGAFIRNSSEAIFRIEFNPPIDTDLPPHEQAQLMLDRGVIAEVNDAFSRQYGRNSASDSIGLTLRDLFGDDPKVIAENLRSMEDLARHGYAVDDLISEEVQADGTPVVFSNSTIGIVEDAKLMRVWGTQRDITDQRRAEQELRKTNTMLELFIEHAPAAVAMFDRNMCYIAASRRWVHDYGIDDQPILGRSHYEVFPEISDEWKQIHTDCMNGKSMVREEDCFERADGSTQWIRWDVRPWHNDSGEIGGIVMFTEEITDRKQAADRLREVNAQQERLLTELDHRVKNALGGLLSLIELGTHEQTDVQTYAAGIARRVRSMASVHAMLSESRWQPLSLSEIVKVITPADTPGEIVPHGPSVDIPAHQATPLAMVLQEFVSNSMKYGALSTPKASAKVSWETTPCDRQGETLLRIVWEEHGGPPVKPNPREGVGSQLIRGFARFELRGSVEFDYSRPQGVRHTLTCRLSEKQ